MFKKFVRGWEGLKSWLKSVPLGVWLVLLFALALRLYHISYGFPLTSLINDEQYATTFFIRLSQGAAFWNTGASPYPMGMTLVQVPVFALNLVGLVIKHHLFSIGQFRDYLILQGSGSLVLAGRFTSALLSGAFVLVLWRFLRRLRMSPGVALVGVVAIAFSIIQLNAAHWGKPHAFMALCFLLAAHFSFPRDEEFVRQDWYLSLVFAGVAAGTHVIGATALIWPALGWLLWSKQKRWLDVLKGAGLFVFVIGVLYGLNAGGVVGMFATALRLHGGTGAFAEAPPPTSFLERVTFLFTDWLKLEPIVALLTFIGIVFGICSKKVRDRRFAQLFGAGLAIYLFSVAIVAMPHVIRWQLVPTLAFLLIALYALNTHHLSPRYLKGLVMMIGLAQLAGSTLWLVHGLATPTPLLARKWIIDRLPIRSELITQQTSPELLLTREAAVKQIAFDEQAQRGASSRIAAMAMYAGAEQRWSVLTLYDAYCPLSSSSLEGAEYVLLSNTSTRPTASCLPSSGGWREVQAFFPSSVAVGLSTIDQNPRSLADLWRYQRSGPYLVLYRRETP